MALGFSSKLSQVDTTFSKKLKGTIKKKSISINVITNFDMKNKSNSVFPFVPSYTVILLSWGKDGPKECLQRRLFFHLAVLLNCMLN